MGITVARPPGDSSGGNIIDSILTTRPSQIERGRAAIEEHMLDKQMKTCEVLKPGYRMPGTLRRIHTTEGQVIGLVTEFSLNVSMGDSPSSSLQITLEIPK